MPSIGPFDDDDALSPIERNSSSGSAGGLGRPPRQPCGGRHPLPCHVDERCPQNDTDDDTDDMTTYEKTGEFDESTLPATWTEYDYEVLATLLEEHFDANLVRTVGGEHDFALYQEVDDGA